MADTAWSMWMENYAYGKKPPKTRKKRKKKKGN